MSYDYPKAKTDLETVRVNNNTTVSKDITVKREFIEVRDGAKVAAFIVYKKGIALDGSNPTLMYGYGGSNGGLLVTALITLRPDLWVRHSLSTTHGHDTLC